MLELFGRIAPRYDLFNRFASAFQDRRWRRLAIGAAQLRDGLRVLDVCTGTGELALACAETLDGAGLVMGADFSRPMLEAAVRKSAGQAHAPRWVYADALHLPVGRGAVDRVLVGFSTRNWVDLSAGLREMARVLAPGGRLVIVEAGKPQSWWICVGYYAYLTAVVPVIGWLVCGAVWPFTYLRRSIAGFCEPRELLRLLREAGFVRTEHRPLGGGRADLFIADTP